jgi:hypothetical protein
MRKNGKEYTVGDLREVFGLSDVGKKYAVAWSNLIETLTKQEVKRYNEPMTCDYAWSIAKGIDKKTGRLREKKYFK